MTKPLWVIDPSTHVAEGEGSRELAELWDGPIQVFHPALVPEESLKNAGYHCAGVVLLGSRASVHDSLVWLDELKEWMGPVTHGDVSTPLLGVCFGHQLLAHVAGGEVGFLREDESKLVAVKTSQISPSGLSPDGGTYQVVCSHREAVKSLPSEVGEREEVPIDVIQHRELPIYGVQFHPEARMEFAGHCGLDLRRHLEGVRKDGRALLSQFLNRVKEAQ